MAIVQMKKLQVIALASRKEELLRELLLLGCVELKEQEVPPEDCRIAALVTKEQGDVVTLRAERQTYSDALRVLDRYCPVKTPFFTPKPSISKQELLNGEREPELLETARKLAAQEERLRVIEVDETRERLEKEALSPWSECSVPLDYTGTKHVAAKFGTVSSHTDMDAFSQALIEASDAVEVITVSEDESARYLLLFYLRSEESRILPVLRNVNFSPPAYLSGWGLASKCISGTETVLEELARERESILEEIRTEAENREQLRIAFDRAGTKVECAEEEGKILSTANALLFDGWAVAERESDITELLERMECAYEFSDPAEEEYPEVPVELKNNPLTEGLNMVTNMYSLPQYGSVDPNPLMAPFFILFYGVMMADMGYGLIMAIFGWLIMKKKHPSEGFLRYFGELMIEGGIATFVLGIFTGGLFGDAPKWIVHLINPASTWPGFPALIDPLNDTVKVLIGAIILGFIHLNAGMVISFVMKKKRGHLADAIWEEGAMWFVFVGIACAFFKIGTVSGIPVVLVLSLLAYCYGKTRGAKGLGKLVAIFSGIYSDSTGWFGDLLSYARLMALMLAGSVIAQVFNTLGAMPGSLIAFIPICIFGNALNFGLNLLGCYVHDLRLQCLEYFNKFYEAGGKAFRPLKIRSKYFDITNN